MSDLPLECLRSYQEFLSIRSEWDDFMARCFPENYARSHAWLSAFWMTYHAGKQALIYVQRSSAGGRIVAAAPLIITRENFGGFPVRMLQTLGRGFGCDDFLIGTEALGTVSAVFADLGSRHIWDVTMLRRVGLTAFHDEVVTVSREKKLYTDFCASNDYLIALPGTYGEYLASRSSKFRNNLMHATKRLEAAGAVSIEILPLCSHAERALELCKEVAGKSWQFKSGHSHFNVNGSSGFYANLLRTGNGAGGEEFVVLLVDTTPVAFMFGCQRGRIYYLIDTAYDEGFRTISVGRVLFNTTIQRLIQNGEVDRFSLEGDGEYKDYYANDTQTVHSITICNRSLYGRCIAFLRRTRLYEMLKRIRKNALNNKQ